MLNERYVSPHWWALRAHSALEGWVPDRLLMEAIGRTSRYSVEPEVTALSGLVDSAKGAIDVGAAYGLYSWNLARICKRCVAFEANPASAGRLISGLPNVVVHACALSDRDGTATLRVPRSRGLSITGYATLESRFKSDFDEWDDVEVQTRTLDSFDLRNIGFIKMDVEGHELAVLQGGEQTIERERPLLLLELDSSKMDEHTIAILEWLKNRGYQAQSFSSKSNALFVPR